MAELLILCQQQTVNRDQMDHSVGRRYSLVRPSSAKPPATLINCHRFLPSGTTLAECKSGYGLNTQNEIKMLRVLEAAKKKSAVEISSTFCGAHSVPK